MSDWYCPECEGELRGRYGMLHCVSCRRAWLSRSLAPITLKNGSGAAHDVEHHLIEELRRQWQSVSRDQSQMHQRVLELDRFTDALVRHLASMHGHRVGAEGMDSEDLIRLHAMDHEVAEALPPRNQPTKRGKR